jgi:hypothetical protein
MVGGCGGGEMSLTEYVETVNPIVDRAAEQYYGLAASPEGRVLGADAAQLTDFTPQDLQTALNRVSEIEIQLMEATDAIEPPEQVADLHRLLFNFDLTNLEGALATRAGVATDWEELSETPEMAAYRVQLAKDKQACTDFRTELNDTDESGVFADVPWMPSGLSEAVEALLGCEGFPEYPEDAYRPPPTSAP